MQKKLTITSISPQPIAKLLGFVYLLFGAAGGVFTTINAFLINNGQIPDTAFAYEGQFWVMALAIFYMPVLAGGFGWVIAYVQILIMNLLLSNVTPIEISVTESKD